MEHYQIVSEKLLRQLGVDGSYLGFRYVIHCVCITAHDPSLTTYICKGLYVEIAGHFHTTVNCVERNIRTIVDTIWTRGNRNLLNKIFCRELTKKPRNAAFIDALANYVRNSH